MSMTWVAVAIDIGDDESIGHMADDCGLPVAYLVGHVVMVLGKCPRHARDGNLSGVSATTIEEWARWRGEPGRFAAALRARMCNDTGVLRAWEKINGAAMRESEAAAKRMRDLRERQRGAREEEKRLEAESCGEPYAPRPRRSGKRSANGSANEHQTFPTNSRQETSLSGPVGPDRAREAQADPARAAARALVKTAEAVLADGASETDLVSLARIDELGDRSAIVLFLHDVATSRTEVRAKYRHNRVARVDDVRRALREYLTKQRPWNESYFLGMLRQVLDRTAEPPTAAEREAARVQHDAAAERRIVELARIELPESDAERSARRQRTADAMREFRGMRHVGDVVESAARRMAS